MKFFLLFLISGSLLFETAVLSCECSSMSFRKNEKNTQDIVYIQPEQIAIENNSFFVFWIDEWIPVNGIQVNSQGFYVIKTNLSSELQDVQWNWICRKCGTENSPFRIYCRSCGSRWNDKFTFVE